MLNPNSSASVTWAIEEALRALNKNDRAKLLVRGLFLGRRSISSQGGGPSSDMQRYEGKPAGRRRASCIERRAIWNISDLSVWIFTRNGFRSRWQREDAAGRWNISARLPTTLMPQQAMRSSEALRQDPTAGTRRNSSNKTRSAWFNRAINREREKRNMTISRRDPPGDDGLGIIIIANNDQLAAFSLARRIADIYFGNAVPASIDFAPGRPAGRRPRSVRDRREGWYGVLPQFRWGRFRDKLGPHQETALHASLSNSKTAMSLRTSPIREI